MCKLIVIFIVFLLGFYYIFQTKKINESFVDNMYEGALNENCPNLLIQKGSSLYLYNSKKANIPGVNPIQFENLDEYVEFTKWQRSQGILCPILFLQHAYNAQGESVYKIRPSPTNLQGGIPDQTIPSNMMPPPDAFPIQGTGAMPLLMDDSSKLFDASRDDKPYNQASHPGFDPNNQYIGLDTPLDKMFNESHSGVSPNPMDTNWGGAKFTQALVESNYYKDNEVNHRK